MEKFTASTYCKILDTKCLLNMSPIDEAISMGHSGCLIRTALRDKELGIIINEYLKKYDDNKYVIRASVKFINTALIFDKQGRNIHEVNFYVHMS
jgi:hypothetical protein